MWWSEAWEWNDLAERNPSRRLPAAQRKLCVMRRFGLFNDIHMHIIFALLVLSPKNIQNSFIAINCYYMPANVKKRVILFKNFHFFIKIYKRHATKHHSKKWVWAGEWNEIMYFYIYSDFIPIFTLKYPYTVTAFIHFNYPPVSLASPNSLLRIPFIF